MAACSWAFHSQSLDGTVAQIRTPTCQASFRTWLSVLSISLLFILAHVLLREISCTHAFVCGRYKVLVERRHCFSRASVQVVKGSWVHQSSYNTSVNTTSSCYHANAQLPFSIFLACFCCSCCFFCLPLKGFLRDVLGGILSSEKKGKKGKRKSCHHQQVFYSTSGSVWNREMPENNAVVKGRALHHSRTEQQSVIN